MEEKEITKVVERLVTVEVKQDLLRMDFKEHEQRDETRFEKITNKVDDITDAINKLAISNAKILGVFGILLIIVQIISNFYKIG